MPRNAVPTRGKIQLTPEEEHAIASSIAQRGDTKKYRVNEAAMSPGHRNGKFGSILADDDGFPRRFSSQVHHLKPLAQATESRIPKLDEFVVVCPNCHRALHKADDPSAWRWLRQELQRLRRLKPHDRP